MKKEPTSFVLILALYAVVYVWQPGGAKPLELLTNVLTALFAVFAAGYALRASRTFETGEPQRRAWLIWGIGMALWSAAELIWSYYPIILNAEAPFPSIADGLWVMGYIPLFTGLLIQYRALGVKPDRRRLIAATVVYVILLAAAAALVLWPMLSTPGESGAVELFLNIFYPVGDLCLALIATLSILVLGRGLLGLPWLHIAFSLALFAASDLVYSYGTWNEIYATGGNLLSGFVDIVYLAGYVVATLGASSQARLSLPELNIE